MNFSTQKRESELKSDHVIRSVICSRSKLPFGLVKILNSVWDLIQKNRIILIPSEGWIQLVILKFGFQCSFKNWHKSKMDQVILDSRTWDFYIRINLIQIVVFLKTGPDQAFIRWDIYGCRIHCGMTYEPWPLTWPAWRVDPKGVQIIWWTAVARLHFALLINVWKVCNFQIHT